MTASRGWTSDSTAVKAAQLLVWLDDENEGQHLRVFAEQVEPGPADSGALQAVVSLCVANDLIREEQSMGGVEHSSALLTDTGAVRVQQIRQRRQDSLAREAACADAIICWLAEQRSRNNDNPVIDAFSRDPRGHVEGEPFTNQEIVRATRYLKDKALIGGTGAMGAGIIRPQLASEGVDCARYHDCSVSDYLRAQQGSGSQIVTHFHAPVPGQVAIAGGDVHQTQAQGIDGTTLQRLLDDVRKEAEQLEASEQALVLTYVDTIQAEAQAETPNPAIVRGTSSRLKEIVARASNPALTTSVAVLTTTLLKAVGLG